MNTWLQKIKVWHSQRPQRSLEQWEKIRANGKPRFVLGGALTYTGIMILVRGFAEYIDDGTIMVAYVGRILIDVLIGTIIGLWSWSSREGEYKNAQLMNPLKPSPDKTLPLT